MLQEFRKIWFQLEATLQIPKARCSQFCDYAFRSLSWYRFSLLLMIYFVRVAIASVLLVAGILWLARTISIEELMLNAVALNAVLDVDEFLFAGMTPVKIHHAMQHLKPTQVRHSRRRSQCESLLHFVMLGVLIISTYLFLLVPLGDTMLAVKNELCGGNQTFVVRYNEAMQSAIGLTTTFSQDDRNLTASELAVQAHKATSPETTPDHSGPKYIFFSGSRNVFEVDSTRTMKVEAAGSAFCFETETFRPNGLFSMDLEAQVIAARYLNNAAASLQITSSSCEALLAPPKRP